MRRPSRLPRLTGRGKRRVPRRISYPFLRSSSTTRFSGLASCGWLRLWRGSARFLRRDLRDVPLRFAEPFDLHGYRIERLLQAVHATIELRCEQGVALRAVG